MSISISEEFVRHAAECRSMADLAYDPTCKSAFSRLAETLEQRGDWLEHGEWRQHHALAARDSFPRSHPAHWLYF